MKASSFAILSLSLFLLAAVPAVASETEGATGSTGKALVWFVWDGGECGYEADSPVYSVTLFTAVPDGVIGWATEDGRTIELDTRLDPPLTGEVVRIHAVYAEAVPEKTPWYVDFEYQWFVLVVFIIAMAYVIVIRMDLEKVCRDSAKKKRRR